MNLWRYLFPVIAAGLAFGVVRAWWDVGSFDPAAPLAGFEYPADGEPDYWQVPDGRRAKAAFDSTQFDFGKLQIGRKMRHVFRVTNEGDFPLVLAERASSCVCTFAELAERPIPPGESAEIALEFMAPEKAKPGEPYRQWADIDTNDAERPTVTLYVEGELTADVALRDETLDFGTVPESISRSRETVIFSFRTHHTASPEPPLLAVTATEFDDPATAEFFEVSTQSRKKYAPHYQANDLCSVAVKVKPGLPPGPFRQTIRLTTNQADVPPLAVTLLGEIGPDVYLSGPGYSQRTNVLSLGTVDAENGAERNVELVEFGPWSKDGTPRVVEVEPQELVAEFANLDGLVAHGTDGSRRWPLVVRVPPEVAANVSETQGRVVIETGHATVGRLEFVVRWQNKR